jgi:hypothetical protein
MKFTVSNKDIVRPTVQHEIEKLMKSKKDRGKALAKLAKVLAKTTPGSGTIIITKDDVGFNFGVYNLSTEEIKEAACILIHLGYNDFTSF